MLKLIVQILFAQLVWHGLAWLGAGWPIRVVGILLGFYLVHRFWERFIFRPFDYLGVMPVAEDDPLMLDAFAKAQATIPAFLRAFPQHKKDCVVKFRLSMPSGPVELVWADVIDITDGYAEVYVRTPPMECPPDFEPRRKVPVSDIVDWQIEFPDGTLRGGYTNQALCKIFERTEGYMHPKIQVHLQRFRDLEEPATDV